MTLNPRDRLRRFRVAIAALTVAMGTGLVMLRQDLPFFAKVDSPVYLAAIILFFLAGAGMFLMLYLRGDISIGILDRLSDTGRERDLESELASLRAYWAASFKKLRDELAALQARAASSPEAAQAGQVDYDRLLESLRTHVTTTLSSEVEAKVEERIRSLAHVSQTRAALDSASLRLRQEIESLTRRGNLNLVIGVTTTVMAVGLLAYMVLSAKAGFESWAALLGHYIPRLTTVIFIEVFSFFFLRLYRTSLSEIRYYQNELTMLDSRRVAFETAQDARDRETTNLLVSCFARTDRNVEAKSSGDGVGLGPKELTEVIERLTKLVVSNLRREKSEG